MAFADGAAHLAQRSEFVLASGGTTAHLSAPPTLGRPAADGRLSPPGRQRRFARRRLPPTAGRRRDTAPLVFPRQRNHADCAGQPSRPRCPTGFPIAWDSEQDGSEPGIYTPRSTADAPHPGGEIPVNTTYAVRPALAAIAVQPSGAFLSSGTRWTRTAAARRPVSVWPPTAPVGGEFRISETTAGNRAPARSSCSPTAVSSRPGPPGCSTAVRNDSDVYARRYGAHGSALSGEIRVNAYKTLHQGFSSAAALPGGGFVIVSA